MQNYHLHLKGFVGGYDFDKNYVDYVLGKNAGKPVFVILSVALSLPLFPLLLLSATTVMLPSISWA